MALPQFSRNYARSGSYENPKTVVDTQSGAIWANAINNIGKTVSNTLVGLAKIQSEEAKQTQKYLDDNAKFVIEQYDSFLENSKNIGVKNPSYSEAALYAIKKKGEAYFGMKRGDKQAEKDYAKWNSKIADIIEYGKAGMAANESFDADYVSGYDKVNTPGGVSTVGVDKVRSKNYSLAMPVRTGTTKNPKETWYFDKDDNIRVRYSSDQISKAHASGQLEQEYIDTTPLSLFSFDAGKIDDIRKDMVKFYNESAILKDNMLGKGYVSDKIKTIRSGKVEYDLQEINMPSVIASTKSYISSKAKSYLKRPSAVNNLWTHTLDQGRNIKDANGNLKYPKGFKLKLSEGAPGTAFDEQTSQVFTEALAQYMYDILPEGKQGSVRKIPETKPKTTTPPPPKPNYDDITSIVQSLKSGDYQDVAFPGTVDSIKKSDSIAKKGQNIVSVNLESGSKLINKEFDLNNKTSLISLAEEIFKGSSKEIRSKRSEFVKQMLSKNKASTSDDKEPTGTINNPLIYKPQNQK